MRQTSRIALEMTLEKRSVICLSISTFNGSSAQSSSPIICWWAAKAGAVGPVNAYALGPNSQTGAYQRHVDRCLGLDKSADDSYVIQAPRCDKFDVSRSVHDIPVVLPHEALHDELTDTPQVLKDLQSLVDHDALPRTNTTHPVVAAAHGAAVVPLAFFCHGEPFAKKFLAFWIQNLISGNRTLPCVLRKKSLCQCGCRGYCTLFPVLNAPRWHAACEVRAAVVGLAFARPAFWLLLRPRTRWPPCVQGGQPHGQHVREQLMPHEGRGNEQLSRFRGSVSPPLETC